MKFHLIWDVAGYIIQGFTLFPMPAYSWTGVYCQHSHCLSKKQEKSQYINLKNNDLFAGVSITGQLSKGTKIAIGASVVSMVVALVGVTMGILYCRRKEYTGHRPTLMDDVDAQDDYRL